MELWIMFGFPDLGQWQNTSQFRILLQTFPAFIPLCRQRAGSGPMITSIFGPGITTPCLAMEPTPLSLGHSLSKDSPRRLNSVERSLRTCVLPRGTASSLNPGWTTQGTCGCFVAFPIQGFQTLESSVSIHTLAVLLHPASSHQDDFCHLFSPPSPRRIIPSFYYSNTCGCQYFP